MWIVFVLFFFFFFIFLFFFCLFFFFFFKQKTAYEMIWWLEFRRVLFCLPHCAGALRSRGGGRNKPICTGTVLLLASLSLSESYQRQSRRNDQPASQASRLTSRSVWWVQMFCWNDIHHPHCGHKLKILFPFESLDISILFELLPGFSDVELYRRHDLSRAWCQH